MLLDELMQIVIEFAASTAQELDGKSKRRGSSSKRSWKAVREIEREKERDPSIKWLLSSQYSEFQRIRSVQFSSLLRKIDFERGMKFTFAL